MTTATLEYHKGPIVSQRHNRRDAEAIKNQTHIRHDGVHEVWIDEPVEQAYPRLFDSAVNEWNERNKAKHPERMIRESYIHHIEKSGKQQPVYETIVAIKASKGEQIDAATQRQILHDYVAGWSTANTADGGRMELIGAYYHDDERGIPHIHVDYIPVARSTRGMHLKVSQEAVLNALGYISTGVSGHKHETALVKWQDRERKRIVEIAKGYGVEIVSANDACRTHYDTQEYKAYARARVAEEKTREVEAELDEKCRKLIDISEQIDAAEKEKAIAESAAAQAKRDADAAIKRRNDALADIGIVANLDDFAKKKLQKMSRKERNRAAKNAIIHADLLDRERALDAREHTLDERERGLRALHAEIVRRANELKSAISDTVGKWYPFRLLASYCVDQTRTWCEIMARVLRKHVPLDRLDTYDADRRDIARQAEAAIANDLHTQVNQLMSTSDIDAELHRLDAVYGITNDEHRHDTFDHHRHIDDIDSVIDER